MGSTPRYAYRIYEDTFVGKPGGFDPIRLTTKLRHIPEGWERPLLDQDPHPDIQAVMALAVLSDVTVAVWPSVFAASKSPGIRRLVYTFSS